MAGLAVDLAPGVAVDGVIADQGDGLAGRDQGQDQTRKAAGQPECGPFGEGKDPLIGGAVPFGQRCGGAEEVGDGAATRGEDSRAGEDDEAMEGRPGEDRGEGVEQGSGFGG
jgi:hypothetical protein